VRQRLPAFGSILSVFAVIAFLVYGWTMVVFLWKLPAWVLSLTLGEIMVVFAYSMTSALLESLVFLGLLLLAAFILPTAWLRDEFVPRGTFAAIVGLGSTMLYMYQYSVVGYDFLNDLIAWTAAGIVLTVLAAVVAGRVCFLVRAAEWLSDQLTVFLFLLLPLSLISLLVVLYRNIF
jgi:hypothetical protein